MGTRTLAEIVAWLGAAPVGTSVDAGALADLLADAVDAEPGQDNAPAPAPAPESTWRERLWLVPPDTRLTLPEAAEALGKSRSWLYKRTGPKATTRIPCRRLEGELVFVTSELRRWIQDHEHVIEPGERERPLRAM